MAGKLILTSAVWEKTTREETVSRGFTRLAKRFKQQTVRNQIEQQPAGRVYATGIPGHGAGFRRFHKASARGQRPQPDTMNLVNSVRDEKTATLRHDVFVDDTRAPYGKYLQDPAVLDRPIATQEDAEQFMQSADAKYELERIKTELTK